MNKKPRERTIAYLCSEQATYSVNQVKITEDFQPSDISKMGSRTHTSTLVPMGDQSLVSMSDHHQVHFICPTVADIVMTFALFSGLRDQLIMMAAKSRFSAQPSIINHKPKERAPPTE